eukprot:2545456-Amphidinium_carterae.2
MSVSTFARLVAPQMQHGADENSLERLKKRSSTCAIEMRTSDKRNALNYEGLEGCVQLMSTRQCMSPAVHKVKRGSASRTGTEVLLSHTYKPTSHPPRPSPIIPVQARKMRAHARATCFWVYAQSPRTRQQCSQELPR